MLEQDRIMKLREQANALRMEGSHSKAVALLQKARKKWPTDANLLTDLASSYASVPAFEKAEECLCKLLERFPDNEELLLFAGDLRGSMRCLDTSLLSYQRVSKLNPKSATSWLKSAEVLERQSRLEDSRQCIERALQLDPKSEAARFREAVLLTREERLDDAAQSLADLLQSGLTDREIHWKAGHQLAKVLDKMGDFSSAAQVWQASKQGMEVNYSSEIKTAREAFELKASLIRKLTEELTPARLKSWRDQGSDLLQPSVLAGHPRSGTTLLETILDRHSKLVSLEETSCMENSVFRSVFGGTGAKPELFDAGFLDGVSRAKLRKAGSDYQKSAQQYLSGGLQNRLLLDKNPMLTHFFGVALRFFPEMKSLILIRDPRDVCLSCYQQPVGVVTSNVSWLRVEDVMRSYQDIMGVWIKLREVLSDGWLEVRYEELVKNTDGEAKKAVEFLGLPWEEKTLDLKDEERTIFSPTYADAIKPVYRTAVRKWERYGELLDPHLPLLDPLVRELGYS